MQRSHQAAEEERSASVAAGSVPKGPKRLDKHKDPNLLYGIPCIYIYRVCSTWYAKRRILQNFTVCEHCCFCKLGVLLWVSLQ